MKKRAICVRRGMLVVTAASVLVLQGLSVAHATPLLYTGVPLSESFDSLTSVNHTSSGADTAPWANDSTLPAWSLFNKDLAAIITYKGNDGAINTGSFYSYGTVASAERALGGLASGGAYFGSPASGTVAGWMAVAITNNTGFEQSSFAVEYDGEQWRDGGNGTPTAQTMVLEYGFGATFGAVGTWTAPGAAFNFTSPTFGATATALDGNLLANRAADRGGSVSTSWAPGSTLWIRWIENNDVGNDLGLAIDNFGFTAVPEPSMFVLASFAAIGLGLSRRRWKATRAA